MFLRNFRILLENKHISDIFIPYTNTQIVDRDINYYPS